MSNVTANTSGTQPIPRRADPNAPRPVAPRLNTTGPRSTPLRLDTTAPRSASPGVTPTAHVENAVTPAGNPIQDDLRLHLIILELCVAIGKTPYAIVGGIALRLLGYKGPVASIDLLVPNKAKAEEATNKLAQSSSGAFRIMPRQDKPPQLCYRSFEGVLGNLWVNIMQVDAEPPAINQPFPTSSHGLKIIKIDSENIPVVVNPKMLLNYKCHAWRRLSRGDEISQQGDAVEIGFLLNGMKKQGTRTSVREVSQATPTFISLFSRPNRQMKALFQEVGFELHPEEGPRQRTAAGQSRT